jgi:50S ribosomal protein L16 3-hydroxylase
MKRDRRRTPALEVHARRALPLGMRPARFLREYWQKQPLLIRGAFAGVREWTTPNDLAGLACEDGSLSRLVIHEPRRDRWKVRNGPFSGRDFARLPKTQWTLLVQDVDKWDVDVARLLDAFAFIPSWRVDDVMVSYATDGGGVGAHVDQYDVFLVQGRGRRRWRISTDSEAPRRFRDDAELKLLRHFAPTHDWVLDPGDVLYLPPGMAHEGTAIGECMTFSVGMRAPAQAELILDFADSVAASLSEEARYADADLRPARNHGEIDTGALRRLRTRMSLFPHVDNAAMLRWFGGFITRYRAAHEAAPRARKLSAAQIKRALPTSVLQRNPWSRVAWARCRSGALLFVAGATWECPVALARALCRATVVSGSDAARLGSTSAALRLLTELINAGHWRLEKQR